MGSLSIFLVWACVRVLFGGLRSLFQFCRVEFEVRVDILKEEMFESHIHSRHWTDHDNVLVFSTDINEARAMIVRCISDNCLIK